MEIQSEGEKLCYPYFEFEILDKLILEQMNPENAEFCLNHENVSSWLMISLSQRTRIQKSIVCNVFTFLNEKHARIFIQNNQAHLNFLMNVLFEYSRLKITNDSEYKKLLVNLGEHLESILWFLKSRYQEYFDFTANATVAHKQLITISLHSKLDRLLNSLPQQKSILLRIALQPIWDFLSDNLNSKVSYQRLTYFELMLEEINNLHKNIKELDNSLKIPLISLNFNSYQYSEYLTSEIKTELETKNTYQSKVDLLSKNLKKYNQVPIYPDVAFDPKLKHIREQVAGWIIEELDHIDRSKISIYNQGQTNKMSVPPDFKLETDLSVAQLGYFIRLLFEAGILTNQNQRDVIKFFASQVKSKKTDNISPESLRTRFYNIEDGTRDAIKGIAIHVLNLINKRT
jgi:hypothetical protein